jgi:hypothetical protein
MEGRGPWRQLVERGSPQRIALINKSAISTTPRVLLSCGSCAPDDNRQLHYEQGACVPVREWRTPTEQEAQLLFASPSAQAAPNRIAIIKIPDALIGILRSLTSQEINSCCGAREIGNPMQDLIVSYLRNVVTFDDHLMFHGLFATPSGRLTTTINPASGRHIGLHFDSWDSQFDFERAAAANRVTINVGTIQRSLLFVNLSLEEMMRLLEIESVPTTGQNGTALGRLFLRSFRSFPVARLLVQPGEAYIASTDFILHDGCTLDATETAWHLTIRGRFSF